MGSDDPLVLALPKGRVMSEAMPILSRAGITPETAFNDPEARQLRFATNGNLLELIRVRSFDVATFVAFGAAQLGVCGSDVLAEFDYPELYAPIDLGVGKCRLVVAEPENLSKVDDPSQWSHVRIATKYPNLTRRHFAARDIQAECIKLNGAIELAPLFGLCRRIVDLTQTGETMKANSLVEVEEISKCSARLVVNRAAMKTRSGEIEKWLTHIRAALAGPCNAA